MEAARENRLPVGKGGCRGTDPHLASLNISRADLDDFALRLDASLVEVGRAQMPRS